MVSLGGGLLTGKCGKAATVGVTDKVGRGRLSLAGMGRRLTDQNLRVADEVAKMALDLGSPPSQVALNWVRSKGVIPVIGARTVAQMDQNLGALDFQLTNE